MPLRFNAFVAFFCAEPVSTSAENAPMSSHHAAMRRPSGRWRLMPQRGAVSVLEIALFLACAGLVAARLPQNLQDVMILTYLWGGLALAWNLAGGYAGMISFGHAAFFAIGAYTSTLLLLHAGLTPWLGLWVGGLIAAAFA